MLAVFRFEPETDPDRDGRHTRIDPDDLGYSTGAVRFVALRYRESCPCQRLN